MKMLGVALIVIGLAGIFLTQNITGKVINPPKYETTGSRIVNDVITVDARNNLYYTVSVPNEAIDAKLTGSFYASGGSGNDIEVLVLDRTNYVNWNNGHQAGTYYDSGKLTTGKIDVSLPAGNTYYLVYSNKFSLLSKKSVTTTVDLSYQVQVP